MANYKRLTLKEREEISRLLAVGASLNDIAKSLSRASSTVSREISSSGVVHIQYYRAVFAQQRANKARHKIRKNHKLDNNEVLREFVFSRLRDNWSPEQIAKRLVLSYPNNMNMHISHESIYSYLYVLPRGTFRKELISHLRREHTHRRRRKGRGRGKACRIGEYLSIEERPKEIEDRIVPGHWEGDLMIGSKNGSAIGTLVERTTRMTFLVKLANRDAGIVRKAFAEQFRHIPAGLKRTLTYDQGAEMAQHKLFTKDTKIKVYFAHPHSPWERGSNENTNGLIRQYFPKKTDFSKISKTKLKQVQDELNDRPRKTLEWYTPHEQFCKLLR